MITMMTMDSKISKIVKAKGMIQMRSSSRKECKLVAPNWLIEVRILCKVKQAINNKRRKRKKSLIGFKSKYRQIQKATKPLKRLSFMNSI